MFHVSDQRRSEVKRHELHLEVCQNTTAITITIDNNYLQLHHQQPLNDEARALNPRSDPEQTKSKAKQRQIRANQSKSNPERTFLFQRIYLTLNSKTSNSKQLPNNCSTGRRASAQALSWGDLKNAPAAVQGFFPPSLRSSQRAPRPTSICTYRSARAVGQQVHRSSLAWPCRGWLFPRPQPAKQQATKSPAYLAAGRFILSGFPEMV